MTDSLKLFKLLIYYVYYKRQEFLLKQIALPIAITKPFVLQKQASGLRVTKSLPQKQASGLPQKQGEEIIEYTTPGCTETITDIPTTICDLARVPLLPGLAIVVERPNRTGNPLIDMIMDETFKSLLC